ncbi:MAG: hypothetical protein AB1705_27840 [Verrucomicrobiota bacterium]
MSNSRDSSIASASRNTLLRIGDPAVPVLLGALDSTNLMTRYRAAWFLREIGPTRPSDLRRLSHHTHDPAGYTRVLVMLSLGNNPAGVYAAERQFVAALDDEYDAIRMQAAVGLASIGYDAKVVLPNLLMATYYSAFYDHPQRFGSSRQFPAGWPDERTWKRAVSNLVALAPTPQDVTEAMRSLLDPKRPDIATAAARGLWRQSRNPEVVLPTLSAVLDSPNDLRMRPAIVLLGEMGNAAKPAVPALARLAASTNLTALTAHQALAKIDPAMAQTISVVPNDIYADLEHAWSRFPLPEIGMPAVLTVREADRESP